MITKDLTLNRADASDFQPGQQPDGEDKTPGYVQRAAKYIAGER